MIRKDEYLFNPEYVAWLQGLRAGDEVNPHYSANPNDGGFDRHVMGRDRDMIYVSANGYCNDVNPFNAKTGLYYYNEYEVGQIFPRGYQTISDSHEMCLKILKDIGLWK